MEPQAVAQETIVKNDFNAEGVETVVGDEKQADFKPRMKFKKWDNEVNFSVGMPDADGWTFSQDGDVTVAQKGDAEARFYPTQAVGKTTPTRLRRVLSQGSLGAYEASAEYEVFRTQDRKKLEGTIAIADYVVTEPSVMVFDRMPASRYLDVDADGTAKDFNYEKKPYHPDDVKIPSYDRLPVCRIYSPYSVSANPYYMDAGLHNVDIQYANNEVGDIVGLWNDSIIEAFAAHGIEVYRIGFGGKLFFSHEGRDVKLSSCESARGVLAGYINIDCAYNKAYDFYRPDVAQDVRNTYAYGIKNAHPEIDHSIVDEVIFIFAKKMGTEVVDEPYDETESAKWKTVAELHRAIDWITDGERKDAGWFYRDETDGFEFEFDMASKPDSNVVDLTIQTKGLVFHRQEALTADEMASGWSRPPDVEGSYAVYHESKRNDQYKTGKAFHIYRPIAWDSAGLSVFCDLDILEDQGVMRITIPQDFLDKAQYPVTVDPTYGYNVIGGSLAAFNAGDPNGSYCAFVDVLPFPGTVSSISAYYSVTHGTHTFSALFALYRHSDGALIDYCAEQTYSADLSAQWNTVNTVNGASLDAIMYDVGIFMKENVNTLYEAINLFFDTVAGAGIQVSVTPYASSTPPSVAPTPTLVNTAFSLYFTTTSTVGNNRFGNTGAFLRVGNGLSRAERAT